VLPAPPSFNVIHPAGNLPRYDPGNSDMVGWASETTLDVEYAHAIAPGANILLVETPVSETEGTQGFPQIVTSWPDSDPLVTGVGGTQLHVTASGVPAAPTVWNDTYNRAANEFADADPGPNPLASGGGLSIFFARPWYQNGVRAVTGTRRAEGPGLLLPPSDSRARTESDFRHAGQKMINILVPLGDVW
jgi:subtilase family serine protease